MNGRAYKVKPVSVPGKTRTVYLVLAVTQTCTSALQGQIKTVRTLHLTWVTFNHHGLILNVQATNSYGWGLKEVLTLADFSKHMRVSVSVCLYIFPLSFNDQNNTHISQALLHSLTSNAQWTEANLVSRSFQRWALRSAQVCPSLGWELLTLAP